jgi:hypothetical protein
VTNYENKSLQLILKYVILSQTVGALKDTVENAKGNI